MDLIQEINSTITKIKYLEMNKRTNNADLIEIELKNQREILNEQIKIAKKEKLRGYINFIAVEGR